MEIKASNKVFRQTLDSLSTSYLEKIELFYSSSSIEEKYSNGEDAIVIREKILELFNYAPAFLQEKVKGELEKIHQKFIKEYKNLTPLPLLEQKTEITQHSLCHPDLYQNMTVEHPGQKNCVVKSHTNEENYFDQVDVEEEVKKEIDQNLEKLCEATEKLDLLSQEILETLPNQGEKLDVTAEKIDKIIIDTRETNQILEKAKQNTIKGRLIKIKAGITGTFTAIGGIIGIGFGPVGGVLGAGVGCVAGNKIGKVIHKQKEYKQIFRSIILNKIIL